MFGNEDVCEIVLFMSDSIDSESLKFSYGVFTITIGCMRIHTCDRLAKEWYVWFLLLRKKIIFDFRRERLFMKPHMRLDISPGFLLLFDPTSN